MLARTISLSARPLCRAATHAIPLCQPCSTTVRTISGYEKRPDGVYPGGHHRSNAMDLVFKVPPISVKGDTAVCDGGGGALGHPVEYISLEFIYSENAGGKAGICKYCGLRYESSTLHHH